MRSREITARRRAVGAELRSWRERANMSGADIARRLSWSQAKVSNMEAGRRTTSEVDAAMYLAVCRAPGEDIHDALAFFHDQEDAWLQLHGDQMSDQLRCLTALETTAEMIRSFELAIIPGLLQTENYTRALIREVGLAPSKTIEPRVQFRQNRQALLRRYGAPRSQFIIHESGLRLPVGGDVIMNEQLLHLVLVSAQPHIAIRVVPIASGAHPGVGGAFTMLEYQQGSPVTYLENDTAHLFLDGLKATRYRTHIAGLEARALTEEQSRSFLTYLANEHDRGRDNHEYSVQAGEPTPA